MAKTDGILDALIVANGVACGLNHSDPPEPPPLSRWKQQQLVSLLRDIERDVALALERPEFALSMLLHLRDNADDYLSGRPT